MRTPHRLAGTHRRWSLVVSASMIAVLAATGCKKKPPEPVEPEPPPPAAVGVVSISPSTGAPDLSFAATVNGSSFQVGATVTIGGVSVADAVVNSENSISLTVPGMATGTYDIQVANPDGGAATLRSGLDIKYSLAECQKKI